MERRRSLRDRVLSFARGREVCTAERTVEQEASLARARSCLALAEYSVQLSSPEREFSYEAIDLLRRSCLWALACDTSVVGLRGPTGMPVAGAPGVPERWAALRDVLLRGPFDDAILPRAQAELDRDALRALARELLAARARTSDHWSGAVGHAWVRVLALVLAAAIFATVVFAAAFHEVLGPNLADRRTWKTSSTYAACDPLRSTCGSQATPVLFHTQEDPSPWAQVDLGDPKRFTRVDVQNRLDCCRERAIPLVVEVSDDEASWTEVARKDEPFAHWTAHFAMRQARYVRLRVARKSYLHLEAIAIR